MTTSSASWRRRDRPRRIDAAPVCRRWRRPRNLSSPSLAVRRRRGRSLRRLLVRLLLPHLLIVFFPPSLLGSVRGLFRLLGHLDFPPYFSLRPLLHLDLPFGHPVRPLLLCFALERLALDVIGRYAERAAETTHLDLLGGGDGVRVGHALPGGTEEVGLRGEGGSEGGDSFFDRFVVEPGLSAWPFQCFRTINSSSKKKEKVVETPSPARPHWSRAGGLLGRIPSSRASHQSALT